MVVALHILIHTDERACFHADPTASVAASKMRGWVKVLQDIEGQPSVSP